MIWTEIRLKYLPAERSVFSCSLPTFYESPYAQRSHRYCLWWPLHQDYSFFMVFSGRKEVCISKKRLRNGSDRKCGERQNFCESSSLIKLPGLINSSVATRVVTQVCIIEKIVCDLLFGTCNLQLWCEPLSYCYVWSCFKQPFWFFSRSIKPSDTTFCFFRCPV